MRNWVNVESDYGEWAYVCETWTDARSMMSKNSLSILDWIAYVQRNTMTSSVNFTIQIQWNGRRNGVKKKTYIPPRSPGSCPVWRETR